MRNVFKGLIDANNTQSDYIKWLCFRVLTFPKLIVKVLTSDDCADFLNALGFPMILGKMKKYLAHLANEDSDEDGVKESEYFFRQSKEKEIKEYLTKVIKPLMEDAIETFLIKYPNQPKDDSAIGCNVDLLTRAINLSKDESNLFRFYSHFENNSLLRDTVKLLPDSDSTTEQLSCLSAISGIKKQSLISSVNSQARLLNTGLLAKERSIRGISSSSELPEIKLNDRLKEEINTPNASLDQLINHAVEETEPAKLSLLDFKYVNGVADIKKLVKQAVRENEKGINILIYGEPGTGKSEFSKSLIQSVKLELKSVSYKDNDGDTLSANQRLKYFNLIQSAFQSLKNSAVVFDEVSDLFLNEDPSFFSFKPTISKKYVNASLENNQIISLYLCNSIINIDPAYLSRFSYILKMPSLPTKQRKQILLNSLPSQYKKCVSQKWLEKTALNSRITARHIENATRIVRMSKTDSAEVQDKMSELFTMYLSHSKSNDGYSNKLPEFYDPKFISTDFPINTLIKKLSNKASAKILLYGIPGTGKTNFAHYLLNKIDQDYVSVTVSQILDKYVGETEANIARLFASAKDEKKAIIIDEVDSLLTSRESLSQHWQKTAVNEFLCQIENFDGILIATSNMLDVLDPAAYRRFHAKFELKPLKSEQKLALLKRISKQYQLNRDLSWLKLSEKLNQLPMLTPGDYNSVNGRLEWQGINTLSSYVEQLVCEQNLKQTAASIGFIP